MKTQAEAIKDYIVKHIKQHSSDIVAVTAAHFDVTRTTVHRHLNKLLQQNIIIKSGVTRDIKYYPASSLNRAMSYKITPTLSEFNVLSNDFAQLLSQLPENVYDICTYAFTEIFNNAIDHAHCSKIVVTTAYSNNQINMTISDDGIGVFKNIYDYYQLDDIRESILQLNKGKMTTDPTNHTGEGLYFTAKAFDVFEIFANKIHYLRDNREHDWSIETITKMKPGSTISMTISADSTVKLIDIFKKHQDPETLAFDRTEILVALSKFGDEKLISRSQAKRITRELDRFNHVTLDFSDVKLAGQGFVDEIFRVYANTHSQMTITYTNANDDVTFMIKRCLATKQQVGKNK